MCNHCFDGIEISDKQIFVTWSIKSHTDIAYDKCTTVSYYLSSIAACSLRNCLTYFQNSAYRSGLPLLKLHKSTIILSSPLISNCFIYNIIYFSVILVAELESPINSWYKVYAW